MNPLRKRFFGDTVVAQRYTGEAMSLLDTVYEQMELNSLSQHAMRRTLGNGVELVAASRFGQDEIQIHVVTPGGRVAGGRREYCIWEDDSEQFTPEITGLYSIGPCTGSTGDVMFGAWISGAGIFSTGPSAEPTTSEVRTYSKADISNIIAGPFALDSNIMPGTLGSIPSPVFGRDGKPGTAMIVPSLDVATSLSLVYLAFDSAGNSSTYASIPTGAFPGMDKTSIHGGYSYESVSYVDTNDISATAIGAYSRTISGINYPLYMTSTTASDWVLVVQKTGLAAGSIARYVLKSGGKDLSYPTDPIDAQYAAGSASVAPVQAVVTNDNKTMWLRATHLTDTGEQPHLYNSAGEAWTEITHDGGWPLLGFSMFWGGTGLLHDPITDAVAMVMGDLSGAWIYNGKDCFGAGLAPFFRKFEKIPVDYAAVLESGDAVARDNSFVKFTQFFDGILYASFGLYLSDYNGNGLHNHKYIGAAYKIGRLKQKKVSTEV